MHWLLFHKGQVWGSVSGLHFEQALQLEGHHLPVVAGAQGEGHPVARGLGQHAGRRWLAELCTGIAWAVLRGQQEVVEVGNRALPILVIVGRKTNRCVLLLSGRGLPGLWRPGVGAALVAPAVAVVVDVKAPRCSCGCCC